MFACISQSDYSWCDRPGVGILAQEFVLLEVFGCDICVGDCKIFIYSNSRVDGRNMGNLRKEKNQAVSSNVLFCSMIRKDSTIFSQSHKLYLLLIRKLCRKSNYIKNNFLLS